MSKILNIISKVAEIFVIYFLIKVFFDLVSLRSATFSAQAMDTGALRSFVEEQMQLLNFAFISVIGSILFRFACWFTKKRNLKNAAESS